MSDKQNSIGRTNLARGGNFWIVTFALVALARGASAAELSAVSNAAPQFIPANDSRFRYEGRVDRADAAAVGIIWQATRVAIDFEGVKLGLRFDKPEGQNFFDVAVDGDQQVLEVHSSGSMRWEPKLAAGKHHLVIFKRSEANAGTVRFGGIEIDAGAKVSAPPAADYKTRMEFIGDSITVGACNEDSGDDQWETRATHNAAKSYVALTAKAFSADHRNIAVSGMGIVTGWVEPHAIQIWDRLYPKAASEQADLKEWMPQVVFVNLGENDDSFSRAKGKPFPANFADEYVVLADAIRGARPGAEIVLLRGGMWGGANSADLRAAWEDAVKRIEAKDKKVHHFVFTHCAKQHPRVVDDEAMANELVSWLKGEKFMAASGW